VHEPDLLEKRFSSTSTDYNDDDEDEEEDQNCVSPQSDRVTSRTGHVARKLNLGLIHCNKNYMKVWAAEYMEMKHL